MADDNQPSFANSTASRLNRRRVMELMAAGTVGLAGCGGGDETPTATPGTGPTDTDVSTTVQQTGDPVTTELASHFPAWEPSNTNLNRFAPVGNEPQFLNYLWFEGTLYRNNQGEIVYFTVDDVEFNDDGTEVTFNFKEDYTWWDGTPLTAEDYLIQRKINQYQTHGSPEAAPNSLELVDDYTVREVRDTPVNPSARMLSHTQALYTKRSYYREWLERYQDAGGESAVEQVTTDLTQTQISFQEAVDMGHGLGPFRPTEWNPTRVTWEKFDDHPRSDWTNLETWTWELVSGDQTIDQAFQNDRFDMGELQFDLVDQHDTIENVTEISFPGVPKLTMNFANKHLGRRGVRRAIAYLIDHDEIREVLRANFGTPYQPHPNINGMADPVANNWVGSDFLGNLIDYGSTAQPEEASEAMRNAGYSMDGDYWVGPDGDAVQDLTYISPPWGIYQQINQYLAPVLSDFGIGTNSVLPSSDNFYRRLDETYEFDMLNWYHAGFHPTISYNVGEQNGPTGLDNYITVAEPVDDFEEVPTLNSETSPRLSHPIRPTIPSEVGATSVSGNGETLNTIKAYNVMGASQDSERIVDLARKLAWYYNYQLPHIGFYEEVWNLWARTDKYTFSGNHPDTETDRTAREHTIMNEDAWQVTLGHVSAKLE